MKLLIWNIQQGGGPRRAGIVDRLRHHDADVVVLIEFIPDSAGIFPELSSNPHWPHRYCTDRNGHDYSLCILSKTPGTAKPAGLPVLDQSGLWLETELPAYEFSIGVVHVPTKKGQKRPYCDALVKTAAATKNGPLLLAGDFNTGRHPIDGDLKSLGGVQQFQAMLDGGFVDAWRQFRGNQQEYSFFRRGRGYRIDHALASRSLLSRVRSCDYSHGEREDGMSDHSALILEIDGSAPYSARP
jgi:exonuclease III